MEFFEDSSLKEGKNFDALFAFKYFMTRHFYSLSLVVIFRTSVDMGTWINGKHFSSLELISFKR